MFESVQSLLAEHAELEAQLSEPDLHSDPARSKRINRRYAELSRVVAAFHVWRTLTDDVAQDAVIRRQTGATPARDIGIEDNGSALPVRRRAASQPAIAALATARTC